MKPIVALATLLAVAGAGCAGASFSPDGARLDGGVPSADADIDLPDAGFTDGADGADAMMPAPSDSGTEAPPGIPADPSRSAPGDGELLAGGGAGPVAACFDGADNDGAGGADCADSACSGLASCCVGQGDCCGAAPTNPLPASLDFSTCVGTAFDACAATLDADRVAGLVAFGSPSPFLDDGALAPGGDLDFDSGATIGAPVDLTAHRLVLSATFADAEGCGDVCLESVALGVTEQVGLGATSHVRPAAALLFSASRNSVALVVASEVVASYPRGDASESWELILRPTGTVTVRRDGVELLSTAWLPTPSAQVLVYGRSRNPTATGEAGARIRTLGTELSLCDMPRAWRERAPVALEDGDGSALEFDRVTGADLAAGPSETLLLVGDEGRLLAATEDSARPGTFVLTAPAADAALVPAFDYDALGVSDPTVAWNEAATAYEAFFTATAADGTRSIGHAMQAAGAMAFVAEPAAILSPADFGFAHLDHPTALRHSHHLLIARATLTDGREQLVAFVDEGAGFAPFASGDLATITDTGNDDNDALGGLSLVIHDHAYHLYFAQRRGTRWQIGLLASDAFVSWRRVDDAALGASGVGFDRLGASGPAARSLGDEIELLFVGHDGVRNTLARTHRLATDDGAPL